jgi:hypothetical protein
MAMLNACVGMSMDGLFRSVDLSQRQTFRQMNIFHNLSHYSRLTYGNGNKVEEGFEVSFSYLRHL